nr:MAG TPA: hypothetical protein [Caudoviricetes sp.]
MFSCNNYCIATCHILYRILVCCGCTAKIWS